MFSLCVSVVYVTSVVSAVSVVKRSPFYGEVKFRNTSQILSSASMQ